MLEEITKKAKDIATITSESITETCEYMIGVIKEKEKGCYNTTSDDKLVKFLNDLSLGIDLAIFAYKGTSHFGTTLRKKLIRM